MVCSLVRYALFCFRENAFRVLLNKIQTDFLKVGNLSHKELACLVFSLSLLWGEAGANEERGAGEAACLCSSREDCRAHCAPWFCPAVSAHHRGHEPCDTQSFSLPRTGKGAGHDRVLLSLLLSLRPAGHDSGGAPGLLR